MSTIESAPPFTGYVRATFEPRGGNPHAYPVGVRCVWKCVWKCVGLKNPTPAKWQAAHYVGSVPETDLINIEPATAEDYEKGEYSWWCA